MSAGFLYSSVNILRHVKLLPSKTPPSISKEVPNDGCFPGGTQQNCLPEAAHSPTIMAGVERFLLQFGFHICANDI